MTADDDKGRQSGFTEHRATVPRLECLHKQIKPEAGARSGLTGGGWRRLFRKRRFYERKERSSEYQRRSMADNERTKSMKDIFFNM